jgi:S1-C subfamily serine protease
MRHFLATFLVASSLLFGCSNSSHSTNPILKASLNVGRLTGTIQQHDYYCTAFPITHELMLTANHCIHDDMKVDGVKVDRVSKIDEYFDLALIRVDTPKEPITFRDREVTVGEGLTGIGFGHGWEMQMAIPQVVTVVRHPWDEGTVVGIVVSPGYIGGMSGGPVVDVNGQVVGMCQRTYDGIGWGVGTKIMKAFLYDAGYDPKE